MVGELLHHGRVVMRRDPPVRQAPGGGFGKVAPLRIAQPAIGLVHLPEEHFQFQHGVKRWRLARVRTDALQGGRRQFGRIVVEQQAGDAALQARFIDASRTHGADSTAHAGAHPLGRFNAEFVEQLCRQARIKRKAVLL